MRSFRIGRLFGIDLKLDWSWLVIFTLMIWNLLAVFAQWHPDWSTLENVTVAGAAALLFFCCILIHEFAHSLVARAFGVPVSSITLFLFGGVSNLEHEPPSAKAEFLTAIVGPLASIGLGVACLVAAAPALAGVAPEPNGHSVLGVVAQLGPVSTLFIWLGPINVMIGVFNMIPGFPLDGGRVLRALLWGATGSLHTATRWATGLGQATGWAFILTGIALTFGFQIRFLGTGLVSGLWLAMIGWFLHSAAAHARTRLDLDDALSGYTVARLMRGDPPSVEPEGVLSELVHGYLLHTDERAVPVVRDGRLLGLVSLTDIQRIPSERWATTPVAQVMREAQSLAMTTPDEPLSKAFERMAQQDIGQLPVLQEGRLVGMLHRRDIARLLELTWRPGSTSQQRPGAPASPRGFGHPRHLIR